MALQNIRIQPQQPIMQQYSLSPKICIFGVGGGGVNSVNNMVTENIEGVELFACNSDSQSLDKSLCPNKIQLGPEITGGLGAGARPEIGRAAAEESLEEVMSHIEDANMVFITAGMGGGTGTGAAPVIAKACRDHGILTVGVVTKPFHFEGTHRMKMAEAGIEEMQQYVDTLIVIPNQNLFRIANEKTTFAEAFKMADSVLQSGVRGVTDLMVMPGLINLDFADIRSAMLDQGKAMLGTGEASGERRAIEAAESAINNPLLDDVSMKGAKGVIINITGGYDMTLFEADEACNRIRDEIDSEANIIFGSTFDEAMEGTIRVSVIATGIDQVAGKTKRPVGNADLNKISTSRIQQMTRPQSLKPQTTEQPEEENVAPVTRYAQQNIERKDEPEEELFEQVAYDSPAAQRVSQENITRGTRHNNAFIPPAPIEIDKSEKDSSYIQYSTAQPPTARSSSHQEASEQERVASRSGYTVRSPMVDHTTQQQTEPARRSSPSLIERITGLGNHSRSHSGQSATLEQQSHPKVAPTPSSASLPAQGSLAIDTPVGTSPQSQQEENDLDIPAFLRRQAN